MCISFCEITKVKEVFHKWWIKLCIVSTGSTISWASDLQEGKKGTDMPLQRQERRGNKLTLKFKPSIIYRLMFIS